VGLMASMIAWQQVKKPEYDNTNLLLQLSEDELIETIRTENSILACKWIVTVAKHHKDLFDRLNENAEHMSITMKKYFMELQLGGR
jgi:hypothetical protein